MKWITIILLLIAFCCRGQMSNAGFNTMNQNSIPKYGVTIGNDTFSLAHEIQLAKSLGVTYFRYNIIMNIWNGVNAGFERLTDSGMNVVWNINYSNGGAPATDFPTNMLGYGDTLRLILDKYQPDLVVLENEEFFPTFHNVNMPAYMAMLQTASPIVHSYISSNGKQLKITDGGLTSNGILILTYRWLKANFSQAVADTFGNRCMVPGVRNQANNPCTNATIETNAANAQLILDAAKNGTIDYVNWHFKELINPNSTDAIDSTLTQVTKYVVRYVKLFVEITTGKPCITNETGQQHNEQPLLVTNMLQEFYDLGFKYLLWYSGDSPLAGARSLFNPNGSIRPNGVAFQTFIYGLIHFGIP